MGALFSPKPTEREKGANGRTLRGMRGTFVLPPLANQEATFVGSSICRRIGRLSTHLVVSIIKSFLLTSAI